MSPEDMLRTIRFNQKKPSITNLEYYVDVGDTEPSDKDLFMIWRDAILVNGHKSVRYLTKPTKKQLEHIRLIYTHYSEFFEYQGFPHFVYTLYKHFDSAHSYLREHSGPMIEFEVHMLGVLRFYMPYLLAWYRDGASNFNLKGESE